MENKLCNGILNFRKISMSVDIHTVKRDILIKILIFINSLKTYLK